MISEVSQIAYSDSPFSVLSFIIPLDVFKVLCSDTVTFRSKKSFAFRRLSVCVFLFVSTNKVLFLSFLTVLTVPMSAAICFSIMKGDKLLISFSSSSDFMTKNLAKFSGLKIVEVYVLSSESCRSLFLLEFC